ncbi:MAG TPA: hypothetical protein VGN37_12205 [Actinocatenispora sp.]
MVTYIGSGPYCYANSLVMALGGPSPDVVEFLTGSAFGFELIGGTLPLFDPYGWDPEAGLDQAIGLLGADCERTDGGTPARALARLAAACADGPVLAGPLDMGLLLYQPGTPADFGDHYVLVIAVDGDTVLLHDPHGHPYATIPADAFLAAWRGAGVPYLTAEYRMRTGFTVRRPVPVADALRASLPAAARWLAADDRPVPAGTLGGAAGLHRLAEQVEAGLSDETRAHLVYFAVRVGARRLADAARHLTALDLPAAAAIATEQARLVGALQYPLVTGDDKAVAARLRELAPTYERLRAALPV